MWATQSRARKISANHLYSPSLQAASTWVPKIPPDLSKGPICIIDHHSRTARRSHLRICAVLVFGPEQILGALREWQSDFHQPGRIRADDLTKSDRIFSKCAAGLLSLSPRLPAVPDPRTSVSMFSWKSKAAPPTSACSFRSPYHASVRK